MVVSRGSGAVSHARFADLPRHLAPGDLLVVNDTKVIRGRLKGRKATGGAVEILLLAPADGRRDGTWEALARPSARLREGAAIAVGEGLDALLVSRLGSGRWIVRLDARGDLFEAVERCGEVPLPPYIRRSPRDPRRALDAERYQTVYAGAPGSVAAPTAGLHFDEEMLAEVAERGVSVARVTLAVGYGTFAPIRTEEVESFAIHAERFRVPPEAARAVDAARRRGGRVVAVGTTSARTLETRAGDDGRIAAGSGTTDLFIRPGHRFRAVDVLLTNFHLPRSSLLALVMAFGGVERIRDAYRAAVAEEYRFFSYGDAMLVV